MNFIKSTINKIIYALKALVKIFKNLVLLLVVASGLILITWIYMIVLVEGEAGFKDRFRNLGQEKKEKSSYGEVYGVCEFKGADQPLSGELYHKMKPMDKNGIQELYLATEKVVVKCKKGEFNLIELDAQEYSKQRDAVLKAKTSMTRYIPNMHFVSGTCRGNYQGESSSFEFFRAPAVKVYEYEDKGELKGKFSLAKQFNQIQTGQAFDCTIQGKEKVKLEPVSEKEFSLLNTKQENK